ncbi:hypothetical protein GCM10010286_63860 [Streptomyces toxytricini]|nr:hypothetical protein GCM10010286_63860 [Streptomyces toxytricini]
MQAGRAGPASRREATHMERDESQRAWAMVIATISIILADLAAIILMNTVWR